MAATAKSQKILCKEHNSNGTSAFDLTKYQHSGLKMEIEAFTKVMGQGMLLTLHNPHPVPILLFVIGSEIRLTSINRGCGKRTKSTFPLSNIKFVVIGKETEVLKSMPAAKFTSRDHFFSIIHSSGCVLDFEANSKDERDAICRGLILAVADEGMSTV